MSTLIRLHIRPGESRLYNMDFVNDLETAETVASVSSFTLFPTGPTVGTPAASGSKAQARVSGTLTPGQLYHVSVTVATSGGNTLVECGELLVANC